MAARGWVLCGLTSLACGRPIVADDGSTGSTSLPLATDGSDPGEGGPPISVTITIGSSGSGESSGVSASSTTASIGTDTSTRGTPSESSEVGDATTMELDFEPIVLWAGSSGSDPDEVSAFAELEPFVGEYDEEMCNVMVRCADNTAPVVEDPILWVNGALAQSAAEIQLGDRVGLLFAFADAECNVSCGATQQSIQYPGEGDGGAASSSTNFPCDTASTNVMLGIDFYEIEDAGEYGATVGLRDVCDELGTAMITLRIGR